MRGRSLHWLALVVAGCSSTTSGTGANGKDVPCVSPSSSYVVHFVEKSGGTCGPIQDEVVNTTADGGFQAQPGCSGTRTVNGCKVLLTDYTCTNAGVTSKTTGEVTWSDDGKSGSGTVQISIAKNGATSCTSSYEVTYTRQ